MPHAQFSLATRMALLPSGWWWHDQPRPCAPACMHPTHCRFLRPSAPSEWRCNRARRGGRVGLMACLMFSCGASRYPCAGATSPRRVAATSRCAFWVHSRCRCVVSAPGQGVVALARCMTPRLLCMRAGPQPGRPVRPHLRQRPWLCLQQGQQGGCRRVGREHSVRVSACMHPRAVLASEALHHITAMQWSNQDVLLSFLSQAPSLLLFA